MKEKYKKAIKKSRKTFKILIIIWVLLLVLVVSPFTYTIVQMREANSNNAGEFIALLVQSVIDLNKFVYMLNFKYISTFIKMTFNYTVLFIILSIIGIMKSAPKSEYEKIEHGSSDWSQNGEQYRILNKDQGIILAEDNYLPLDKRGNLNLLIVGRIWIR